MTLRSTYSAAPPTTLAARVDRLRTVAEAEPRLEGVLLYGSWTVGEADAYSDIEAYVFVADEHLREHGRDDAHPERPAGFDGPDFVQRLTPDEPLKLSYVNQFGILAVVFGDLMRGEFHFVPASSGIQDISGWRGMVHLPDPARAVLLDRTGALGEAVAQLTRFRPPEPVSAAQQAADELANWTLMVAHLLGRGETARAQAFLSTLVAPPQLQLCRLLRGSTAHWLTPSRALEADLSATDQARYRAATASAEPHAVTEGVRESWRWSRELVAEAAKRWGTRYSPALHEELTRLLQNH